MRWRRIALVMMVIAVFAIAGCTGADDSGQENVPVAGMEESNVSAGSDERVTLTVWSHYDGGWEYPIRTFEERYPNVTVDIVAFPFGEYRNKYIQAILEGTPPDVMLIDSAHFGIFTNIEGLENLLDQPYDAGKYRTDFGPAIWQSSHSIDNKKLIGLPYATAPIVTYYRADLMEQYGFPSEPEALAEYMEDPNNWLQMGKTLKEHDIWLTQWPTEPLRLYESSQGMFDENLRFQRNNERFAEGLDVSKTVNELGLDMNVDVWTEVGAQAVRDGRLAMLYLGTWGADQIRAWAPETEGLWRETRLPFGLYGWSNFSVLTIPSDAQEKELAWKFIEHAAISMPRLIGMGTSVPAYIPARDVENNYNIEVPFLGNQKPYALHREMIEAGGEHRVTPLDDEANAIWLKLTQQAIEQKQDSRLALDQIEKEIEAQLGRDRDILLKWR